MIYQGKDRYPVHEVVLHTAALGSPSAFFRAFPTPEAQRDEIRRWHMTPGWQGAPDGWSDIGYHAVCGFEVDLSGGGVRLTKARVVPGRSFETIGAHVKERNRGTLGICMLNTRPHVGISKFEDYFPEMTLDAVRGWIRGVADQTDLKRVTGHNDYANRECPGFKVKSEDWMPRDPWWAWLMPWRLK